MERPVGYRFLAEAAARAGVRVPSPLAPTRVDRVQAVLREPDGSTRIPPAVAPRESASPVEHALFALRYEPLDLATLAAAMQSGILAAADVHAACVRTPTGQFGRRLGYLYETLTGVTVGEHVRPVPYVDLADNDLQYTRTTPRVSSTKWRLHDNALGNPGTFSPLVRRSEAVEKWLRRDIHAELEQFIAAHKDSGLLDRAVDWAYLSETESTFAIERDAPSGDRRARFLALLRQAGVKKALTEEDLCDLQRAAISNPFEQALSYRQEQNWLVSRRGRLTAGQITYLPPPPAALPELMEALLTYVNEDDGTDPRLRGAVASFGFVYFHPFMDGNGRVSRFLVHHVLRRSEMTPDGLVLPVSVVMHADERGYSQALNVFSRPVRELWDITVIDEERIDAQFHGSLAAYRYPDLTEQTAYVGKCVAASLDQALVEEANYLQLYDAVYQSVNEAHDIRGKTLAHLIHGAMRNAGRVSNNLRKQYAQEVPAAAFDLVEARAQEVLASSSQGSTAPRLT
jgi:hypothetical protein